MFDTEMLLRLATNERRKKPQRRARPHFMAWTVWYARMKQFGSTGANAQSLAFSFDLGK